MASITGPPDLTDRGPTAGPAFPPTRPNETTQNPDGMIGGTGRKRDGI